MWPGLVRANCEGSLSVEKDFGIGGTAGTSEGGAAEDSGGGSTSG